MAGSINKAILIGRAGKDPEIARLQSGKPVAKFSLATSEQWNDRETGERKERTTWHNIVVYNEGLCGVIEKYVRKGSQLYIEGAISNRSYEKDGQKHWVSEITLQGFNGSLTMLDSRTDSQPNTGGNEYGDQSSGRRSAPPGNYEDTGRAGGDIDDEIPFNCEWRA